MLRTKSRYRFVGVFALCAAGFCVAVAPASYPEYLNFVLVLSTGVLIFGLLLVTSWGELSIESGGGLKLEEFVLGTVPIRRSSYLAGSVKQVVVRRYSLFANRGMNKRRELPFHYYLDLIGPKTEITSCEFDDPLSALETAEEIANSLDAELDTRRLYLSAKAI